MKKRSPFGKYKTREEFDKHFETEVIKFFKRTYPEGKVIIKKVKTDEVHKYILLKALIWILLVCSLVNILIVPILVKGEATWLLVPIDLLVGTIVNIIYAIHHVKQHHKNNHE